MVPRPPRRRARRVRLRLGRGAAAAVLLAGLAACGAGGGRGAPTAVTVPSAPGPPVTSLPAITAPLGARLAIATSDGMEIWSASTGVFTLGPAQRDVTAFDLAWSPDGGYLSWQTASDAKPHGDELWYAAVATGATRHWGPLPSGQSYGPVVVTATGVLTLGAVIRRYSAATGATEAVTAGPDPSGALVSSWWHGWVTWPAGNPAGGLVRRLGPSGAGLSPTVAIDTPASSSGRLDLVAVAGDGREAAAELGRHRAGCELSGSAQLAVVSLATGGGSLADATPPTADHSATQRFWDIDVSGPPGSIFASTFECAAKGKDRGRVTGTFLWNYRAGTWHRVGTDLVAADELGDGPLATLGGAIQVTHGVAGVVAGGAVRVDGQVVATGGEALAWAPDPAPSST